VKHIAKSAIGFLLAALAVTVAADGTSVYTLYRDSSDGPRDRVHVATFDANYGASYNMGTCQEAAQIFADLSAHKAVFWCERGRYRP